jgi:hypothetical protein
MTPREVVRDVTLEHAFADALRPRLLYNSGEAARGG